MVVSLECTEVSAHHAEYQELTVCCQLVILQKQTNRGSGWGTHVNPWLIHVNIWQKSLQYCKVTPPTKKKINEK